MDSFKPNGAPIRVLMVDDHQLLAEAMTLLLNKEPDVEIVGSASTGAAARALIEQTRPDVLLLDVALPDGDGIRLVPELLQAWPSLRIVLLTSLTDDDTLARAVETGVHGFLGKHQPVVEVLTAIRRAYAGEIVMPARLLLGLLAKQQAAPPRPSAEPRREFEPLTPRERAVLAHTAQGKSSEVIAQELNISLLTVRTHLRNIIAKFNVHSRLEAVAFALKHQIIEPPR